MRWSCTAACLLALLALGAARGAAGASVTRTSLGQMLAASELVFEGRVVGHSSRTAPDTRFPQTCARFAVDEVLKGWLPSRHLVLCFAGGTADGLRLRVPGLIQPRVGERGVYFVASLSRPYLNPLYGWDQGHFLIEPDAAAGGPVVKTAQRRRVVDVRAGRPARGLELSAGVARGVRTAERGRALNPAAFKARLRRLLRKRR